MLELMVFDFDGVIRPLTMEIIYEAYKKISENLLFTKRSWENEGGDNLESFKKWFKIGYLGNLKSMGIYTEERISESERLFRESVEKYGMYKDFLDYLPKLKSKFKLAIVTNGPEINVKRVLGENVKYFDLVIGKESLLGNFKPNPYGLVYCLDSLKVPDKKAMFIGDHISDICAGRGANYGYVIGVSWGISSYEELKSVKPDKIMRNHKELFDFLNKF